MDAEQGKQRLVQQMAKIAKVEAEIRASLKQNSAAARARLAEIDQELARLRPVLEQWMKQNYEPDTPALREVGERYIALIEERADTLMAEDTGDLLGDGDETGKAATTTPDTAAGTAATNRS